MPTVNIYFQKATQEEKLSKLIKSLKELVAEELTCNDIRLDQQEISIRLITSRGNGMIAEIEVEISAAAFQERVSKQDKICMNIREFLMRELADVKDIRVWLILSELGHSWE